jgi:beta-galactosidase
MLKLSALQAMANGAEMLLHFQFRTFPGGAEQLNYAILDMDGQPRRRYYEMQDTAATLKRLEPLFSSKFQNEVAVCFDYDVLWALKIKPIHEKEFDYVAFCERFYHLLQSPWHSERRHLLWRRFQQVQDDRSSHRFSHDAGFPGKV